ncbi:MAG: 50S ribosomal protein L18 [Deltaproteobacteria bacterium]|nr:50S ribosomal protein L18 [Deltaproteobacteria bacterium]
MDKELSRLRRHRRIRKTVEGTPERPRLSVFRSLKHIYAQVIDDSTGKTLVAVSTLTESVKSATAESVKIDAAKAVGKHVAEVCKERGIAKVVFDRGGYLYHGRVKALADAAREAGLSF